MPDKLTTEEQAAIAAFPHERVYRCARGESGIPINGTPPRERQRQAVVTMQRQRQFDKSRRIDEEIRNMWAEGLTDKEISEKVKLTLGAVKQRRFRLSLSKRK
jgi:DNA-binding NarL/FixJ family response regulator